MPLTRSLVNCRIDLCQAAGIDTDAVGGSITRHSTTELNGFLNKAHRSLRSWVTNKLGYKLYKTRQASAPLPTAATVSGEQYAEIGWPATAVDVLGVDVLTSSDQDWRPLEPVDWESRRSFGQELPSTPSTAPYAWAPISEGSVSAATFTAGVIALFPVPTGGTYTVWFLPHWADITTDAHLFLCGDEDWFLWMTAYATLLVCQARDNGDAPARVAWAQNEMRVIGAGGKPDPMTAAGRIAASAPKKVKAGGTSWVRAENYHG